ncbi:TetR/AcrR family transcriptional regulator [Methylobacterium sp. NEAU K]|uniref:TetR/AcrR family transcriptional regulator n=1 Tax=Methylobacterium sp. NEAU K TaxID=3064946 RepID=UPI0027327063|nr:TetR/AcrR family transcriptional regulator [Methylobacterium sp. NEAU K]MDP4005794.1 TetR/AcrR family transcriptional regulator [Methylobacterium sp. NEAU K]
MSTSRSEKAYHHGDLRAALVSAALELLEGGGEAALSLRAVARTCGVSAMAPYRHFAGKEDLLEAVAARGFEDLAEALGTADASAAGAEALAAQGAAYVAFACRRPALFRLMFMTPCRKPDRPRAYGILEARAAALAGPAMPAEDLTLAAWSLVHGLAALILDGRIPPEAGGTGAVARRITLHLARLMAGVPEPSA